jgi:transcriptional regulator with XRE-family HTH domain
MPPQKVRLTTREQQAEIGKRLKAERIRAGLEQTEVAALANISVGAVKNLEGGKGSSLSSFIRVLRALKLEDVLDTLPPADMPSPMLALRMRDKSRLPSRVVKSRRKVKG